MRGRVLAKKPRSGKKKTDDVVDAEVVESAETQDIAPETEAEGGESPEAVEPDPGEVEAVDAEPEAESPPVEMAAAAPESGSNGVVPLVIGGLVAGLIGFGVATYTNFAGQTDYSAQIAEQKTQISALEAQIAAVPRPEPTDLSTLETQLADIGATQSQQYEDLTTRLAALDERLVAVEKQPGADGALSQTALDAYERELAAIRDQLAGQQSDLQAMVDATTAQLDQTRAEAAEIEANAVAAARSAVARSELAKIQMALDAGAPIGPSLSELANAIDIPVPDALTRVADGAPTLPGLQADFPPLAREALAVARQEGQSGEEAGGLTAFLRNQLEVRSVAPREGNSVNAVLSRAEAALSDGRLLDTMSEIGALPEVARAVLTDWLAQAEARAAALDAVSALTAHINEL